MFLKKTLLKVEHLRPKQELEQRRNLYFTEGTVPREEGPTRHASGAGKEEGHQG